MTGQMVYVPGEAPRAQPDFHVFHRYAANFPWRSHAVWFLAQMARWGRIARPADALAVAREVYRPDSYRAAAEALGVASPLGDLKTEGRHAGPWTLADATAPLTLGAARFFDGRLFDPLAPETMTGSPGTSPLTDATCNPQERS
jgi:nitrate/nitrite transport system substrate-binding protein